MHLGLEQKRFCVGRRQPLCPSCGRKRGRKLLLQQLDAAAQKHCTHVRVADPECHRIGRVQLPRLNQQLCLLDPRLRIRRVAREHTLDNALGIAVTVSAERRTRRIELRMALCRQGKQRGCHENYDPLHEPPRSKTNGAQCTGSARGPFRMASFAARSACAGSAPCANAE